MNNPFVECSTTVLKVNECPEHIIEFLFVDVKYGWFALISLLVYCVETDIKCLFRF